MGVVLLEAGARYLLHLTPLRYTMPYEPVFLTGNFANPESRADMAASPDGPGRYGYQPDVYGNYVFRGTLKSLNTDRTAFLFSHYLSRYTSAVVDDVVCNQPQALKVFVLGGSVAVGTSASRKETTWHAVLEARLRAALGRDGLYVFNAAMSAFISVQERLAFGLAVAPRDPQLVLVLDGFNDLNLALAGANRPGDSGQSAGRFTQVYRNPLVSWLVESSAIANAVVEQSRLRPVVVHRERIRRDDVYFRQFATAAVRTYMDNTEAIIEACRLRGAQCLIALQPNRPLSKLAAGIDAREADENRMPALRVAQLYQMVRDEIKASAFRQDYVDLSDLFSRREEIAVYTDSVHMDDRGQAAIAARLEPVVADRLRMTVGTRTSSPLKDDRCARLRNTGLRVAASVPLGSLAGLTGAQLPSSAGARHLLSDPRPYAYSAYLPLDRTTAPAGEAVLRIVIHGVRGVVGIGLWPTLDAKTFLEEKVVAANAGPLSLDFYVHDGRAPSVLLVRNFRADGASELSFDAIQWLAP